MNDRTNDARQDLIKTFRENAVECTYYIGFGSYLKNKTCTKHDITPATYDRLINPMMLAFDHAIKSPEFLAMVNKFMKEHYNV